MKLLSLIRDKIVLGQVLCGQRPRLREGVERRHPTGLVGLRNEACRHQNSCFRSLSLPRRFGAIQQRSGRFSERFVSLTRWRDFKTALSMSTMPSAMNRGALPPDPCSYSNPNEIRVCHIDFEIFVNFERKTLVCWGRYSALVESEQPPLEMILDTRELDIRSVRVEGNDVKHAWGDSSNALGTALKIPLSEGIQRGDAVHVEIAWETSPNAVALQWLAPENTAGKSSPFLFTQCQAIHARSMAPVQDTPGAKFTYSAVVGLSNSSKNSNMIALMSALRAEDIDETDADYNTIPSQDLQNLKYFEKLSRELESSRVFRFVQPMPLSSYLVALAAGSLVGHDLSDRSRVWSEPETIKAAAYEFNDTAKFLQAAEEIAGPYRWGRYDLLLLPPAFPYGGMENVNLTFVTPTLLAGDRSLVNVVAHEAAHSWTGNLVTNANWSSFFLNEGWTVWLERRILGHIYGEQTFQFHAALGWGQLEQTVQQWGPEHPYTQLVPDLSSGVDPDDAFSRIPYEKGFALIAYLENLVGGKDVFIPFFKAYVLRFANEPVTAESFKNYFCEYFSEQGCQKVCEVDWNTWFFGRGMPPITNEYDMKLAEKSFDLARKWHCCDPLGLGNETGPTSEDESTEDIASWSSEQIVAFLNRLNELRSATPMHTKTIQSMKTRYHKILEETRNAEIRCSWYLLRIRAGDETVIPEVDKFLAEQGRMKFLRPLYKALFSSGPFNTNGKCIAREIFEKHRNLYHPIAAKMVATDLKV